MPADISEYGPQFGAGAAGWRRAALGGWAWAAAAVLAVLGLSGLAPWAGAHGHEALAAAVYKGFSAACHQMPERSFHLWGLPLAVCARCAGLYVGAAAGVLLYPLARDLSRRDAPARGWLLWAALPTSVDFALGLFGIWENTHLSRFLTALVLGGAAAFYVVPAAVGLSCTRLARRSDGRAAAGVGPA